MHNFFTIQKYRFRFAIKQHRNSNIKNKIKNSAVNRHSTKQKDSFTSVVLKTTPVYGITIPVIIRSGKNTSAASFSAISFNKT